MFNGLGQDEVAPSEGMPSWLLWVIIGVGVYLVLEEINAHTYVVRSKKTGKQIGRTRWGPAFDTKRSGKRTYGRKRI